jgi:CRP/FNR family transcriptional regulator, anaerobic regulatory protein
MQEIIRYLESIHPLPAELREQLLQLLKHLDIPRKEFLLKAGQVSRRLCFIEKGLLRSFYEKDDTEVTTWFLKEGDVAISMASFFEQAPSNQSIQAIEDTSIYYITFEELQGLYQHAEFNILGRILTERFYRLWTDQHNAIKMQSATERYQWLMEHYPDIVLRVPAKYIASYLGITEVTLSRIRAKRF